MSTRVLVILNFCPFWQASAPVLMAKYLACKINAGVEMSP